MIQNFGSVKRTSWPARGCVLALSVVLCWASSSEAVHLRGQIIRVGYSGSSSEAYVSAGDVYRLGRWAPVCIELTNDDGDQFEGRIEVRQTDADGDEVVATQEVAIRGMRQFTLYASGGPISDNNYVRGVGYEGPAPFTVRVFDREGRLAKLHNDAGEPVKELRPPRQVIPASPNALVVLDISHPPVGQLSGLKEIERIQEVIILRGSPRDLPDSHVGLELVDVVVWDSPDPGSVDPQQNEALLEWIRRGGRLVIGVSRGWNSITQSKFGPLLPAKVNNTASSADRDFLADLVPAQDDSQPERAITPLLYCPLSREAMAPDSIPVLPPAPKPDEQIWVVRRVCQRGEIVMMPAELKEALSLDPSKRLNLLRNHLLRVRGTPQVGDQTMRYSPVDVFNRVATETAFRTTSGLYFAFAFAFVIGYIILVTGGSWGWLRRHGRVRHAWVASAVLALAASAASLGAVQLVRAWGQGVHEMTVVDGQAGSFDVVSTGYLGLKTASHTLLDLCVPKNWTKPAESPELRGSLRPYATDSEMTQQTSFAVSQRYDTAAPLGELRSVPLRATLKQFEVAWRGSLDGRLLSSLRWGPQGDELHPSSTIENQLGCDLHDCYVFARPPGPGRSVFVYALAELADKQRVDMATITKAMEKDYEKTRSQLGTIRDRVDSMSGEEKKEAWSPPELQVLLDQCLRDLGVQTIRQPEQKRRDQQFLHTAMTPYVPSLLVLTFFDHDTLSGLLYQGQDLQRSQGRDLEMSSRLQPGTALIVGFSEDPGPMRLCRRKPDSDADAWKPITPSRSAVMYRFTAPIQ